MLIIFMAQSLIYDSTIPLTGCCASLQPELRSGLAAAGGVGDAEPVGGSAAVAAAAAGTAARSPCATAPL